MSLIATWLWLNAALVVWLAAKAYLPDLTRMFSAPRIRKARRRGW